MAHTIEVAKSGRATCRSCRSAIGKGELRFGEEMPSQFGDLGDTTFRWHHLKCAAEKLPIELRAALGSFEGEVPDRAALEATMSEAERNLPPPFPYADKAPTGRATCQGCGEKIAKDSIRVAFERELDRGAGPTKGAGYLHPACAAAYIESQGGTHAALTEGLRANTRALTEDEMHELFAEV